MKWFERLPIRHKLLILLVLASALSLGVGTVGMLAYDVQSFQRSMEVQLTTLANVVGHNSQSAIAFSDVDAAEQTLLSLEKEESVDAARLFDASGQPFATFQRIGVSSALLPDSLPDVGVTSDTHSIRLTTQIDDVDGTVGFLCVVANTTQLRAKTIAKLKIALIYLIGVIGLSGFAAYRMQNVISRRIVNLSLFTQDVQERQDYSARVDSGASDEIGSLCDAFNKMLSRVEQQQGALTESHNQLESRVHERTTELQESNRKLQTEILRHQHAREELQALQEELMSTARAAGMAEIATGVLHNVGNVLNSVNVSANLIREQLQGWGRYVSGIEAIHTAMDANESQLGPFFEEHPQGSRLIEFLKALGTDINQQREILMEEAETLHGFVDHVKEIVAAQQSMSRVSGVMIPVRLSRLFSEAIMLNDTALARHGITVIKDFADDPEFQGDKHRILQIFVNLISNAKNALDKVDNSQRTITLALRTSATAIFASVTDSGIGIDTANLSSIFRHGFTTRDEGHGFGLHSSALAATEMGGHLTVDSAGPGKGAVFILELPLEIETGRGKGQPGLSSSNKCVRTTVEDCRI